MTCPPTTGPGSESRLTELLAGVNRLVFQSSHIPMSILLAAVRHCLTRPCRQVLQPAPFIGHLDPRYHRGAGSALFHCPAMKRDALNRALFSATALQTQLTELDTRLFGLTFELLQFD